VLRQGRVTAGRTVIKETMSPNVAEDTGSEIQTVFFIMESPIGRTFSCDNNPPITKDSS